MQLRDALNWPPLRWLRKSSRLQRRMRTLPWISVIINRRPLQGLLVTLFFTHGMLIIINAVVYGMWVPPSYWWASSFYGDFCLALAISILLWLAPKVPGDTIHTPWAWTDKLLDHLVYWKLRYVPDALVIAAMYWVGWQHMLQEHASIGSWERHFGAAPAYHNLVLYPLLGYTLWRLFWRCVLRVSWRNITYVIGMLVTIGLIYAWYRLGQYDGSHPLAPNGVSKFVYSAPVDGWQNIRIAFEWVLNPIASLFG